MEDPELNRNLEETKELHTRWGQFHDFFNMALKGEKINPQAEMKFLELKTRIAMLHDGFLQALTHDKDVGQNVLQILGACIMLKRVPVLSNAEVQKLEFDWNECYLLMTETISTLEEEKIRLSGINEKSYRLGQFRERVVVSVRGFFGGPYFKALVGIAVVGFIVLGVPMMGIYNYANLKADLPWTAPVYDRVAFFIRFFNTDFAYNTIEEIDEETYPTEPFFPNPRNLQGLTKDWFFSQAAASGYDTADLTEVKDLLDNHVKQFKKEIWQVAGARQSPLRAMYFLFDSTENAKKFLSLRQRGLAKRDQKGKDRVNAQVSFARRANLVFVFNSQEEALRTTWPQQRWGFEAKEMGL